MADIFSGWQNRNENRNFPLHDHATKLSVSGVLMPDDILADAHLALPHTAGRFVFVSSVSISPALVSLTFLAIEDDPIDGGVLGAFVPIGTLTVQKPIIPYRNYPLTAIYPGFGGWISFGTGVTEIDSLSLQFTDPAAAVFAAKAVRSYRVLPISAIGSSENATNLTGLVHVQGQAGLIKVQRAVREIDGINREVLSIGLDLEEAADPVELLLRYAGPCGRPEQRTCPGGKAILTINGVTPDCAGNIRIRVQGLDATLVGITAEQLTELVASGNVIDLPIGLEDICPVLDPNLFDPEDLCVASSSSSSSEPSSSSSSSSEDSSSSSSPGASSDEYCDDFEDEAATFANLVPQSGSWDVDTVTRGTESTGRLISSPGITAPQVIIHDDIYKAPGDDGYIVEATIKARTEGGNGHVIFAYKNADDFWFAGLSLRADTGVNGLLYVGRKTASRSTALDNWPNGLDYGYFFVQAITPDQDFGPAGPGGGSTPPFGDNGLFNTDIRVIIEVVPIAPGSDINLVSVSFEWDETHDFLEPGNTPFGTIIFAVSPSDSDMRGYAGLGVVGSETEFDAFGVDCDGWSSSSNSA